MTRAPTVRELQDQIEYATRVVSADEVKPIIPRHGVGIVATVEGSKAAVRKGGLPGTPTQGFDVPPNMELAVDDEVLYLEIGGRRVIREVLNRNAITLDPAVYAPIISSGTIVTPALTAADIQAGKTVSTATVEIQTGLTYAPAMDVFHFGSEPGGGPGLNWRRAPNTNFNAAGQMLDNFRYSFRPINTNQTRLAVATQTTRPDGIPAQIYRWLVMAKQIG